MQVQGQAHQWEGIYNLQCRSVQNLDSLDTVKEPSLIYLIHFPFEEDTYENLSYKNMVSTDYIVMLCERGYHQDWMLAGKKAGMIREFFMSFLQNPSDTKDKPRVFAIINSLNALRMDKQSFDRLMEITFEAISNMQYNPDSINEAFKTILADLSSLEGHVPSLITSALLRFKDGTLPGQSR